MEFTEEEEQKKHNGYQKGCTYSKPRSPPNCSRRTKRMGIDLVPRNINHLPKSRRTIIQTIPKSTSLGSCHKSQPDTKPYAGKAYSLDNNQKRRLEHSFPRTWTRDIFNLPLSLGGSFLLRWKKDGKLHPCQDYRRLNEQTIPNKYPYP